MGARSGCYSLGYDPGLYRRSHLVEFAGEEVIGVVDYHERGLGSCCSKLLELRAIGVLVGASAEEEFWLVAGNEKLVAVKAAFGGERCTEGNDRLDIGVRTGGAHTRGSPERESGEDDRQSELIPEPFERDMYVIHFSGSKIVFTFAQTGASEVKAQYRKAEVVQGFHCVKDDFVVERASVERMGMANDGRMCGITGAYVQDRLEAPHAALQEQGSNPRVSSHSTNEHSSQIVVFSPQILKFGCLESQQ